MNKKFWVIVLIFLVPLFSYWALAKENAVVTQPAKSVSEPEMIKFSSPMCFECQKFEKILQKEAPKYTKQISFSSVNVTATDKTTLDLIRKHGVRVVPTTLFITKTGKVLYKVEGSIDPEDLEYYIKGTINE